MTIASESPKLRQLIHRPDKVLVVFPTPTTVHGDDTASSGDPSADVRRTIKHRLVKLVGLVMFSPRRNVNFFGSPPLLRAACTYTACVPHPAF